MNAPRRFRYRSRNAISGESARTAAAYHGACAGTNTAARVTAIDAATAHVASAQSRRRAKKLTAHQITNTAQSPTSSQFANGRDTRSRHDGGPSVTAGNRIEPISWPFQIGTMGQCLVN